MANQTAKRKRRDQSHFSQIPSAQIPRSAFDRSHGLKTAFDAGELIPIYLDETLPGDTFNLRTSSFVRMSSPLYPILDNLYMDFFFFAVPYRLVWANWQKFCGEQTDPGDSIDYTLPLLQAGNAGYGTLSDYFGIPQVGTKQHTCLYHRAYNLIWNEWFRDENLQDSADVETDDGPDLINQYSIRRRGKRHDYFTSCLPFRQKGTPVELPLGTTAPVVEDAGGGPTFTMNSLGGYTLENTTGNDNAKWDTTPTGGPHTATWDDPGLEVNLASATAATINQIREAFQVQRLLERDARGGTRYTEILRSHFGVISPDQRLQRPEYLGGGSVRINVNPVAVTADTGQRDVGDLAAFATAAANEVGFVKSFTEHCILMGLVNVRADLTYQQGLNKMFTRSTRYDFYWPALAHLGEQAVLQGEIFSDGTSNDDIVFGYQERYAEYRYKPSTTTFKMRSDHSVSLDAWHLGLDFSAAPTLSDSFIKDLPPMARILATAGSEPHFFGDFYFNLKCARPMPTYAVPGMVDHF